MNEDNNNQKPNGLETYEKSNIAKSLKFQKYVCCGISHVVWSLLLSLFTIIYEILMQTTLVTVILWNRHITRKEVVIKRNKVKKFCNFKEVIKKLIQISAFSRFFLRPSNYIPKIF